jgi:outer membrane protein OmpA-like peptidoglycan-associated protein
MKTGGRDENYWPGFVDVLSNVVLTLVFVLIVFVFALSISANKVEQRMQEVIKAEAELKAKTELAKASTASAESVQSEQVPILVDQKNVEIIAEKKDDADKVSVSVVALKRESDKLVVSYPKSVVEIDAKSYLDLYEALQAYKVRAGNYKILLRSVTGSEAYSVSRRLAYYRAITIRNYLIEKGIAASSDIRSKVIQSADQDVGRVEIIFQSK